MTTAGYDDPRLDGLLSCCPDATLIVDPAGVIVRANAIAEGLFKCGPDGLLGLSIEELMPVAARDRHVHNRASYQAAPRTRAMGEARELFALDRNGREFPVEISLAPFALATCVATVACLRDISARRNLELKIREAEREKLKAAAIQREILDVLPANVALLNEDGVVVSFNNAWHRFASDNGFTNQGSGLGVNYLHLCESAVGPHSEGAREVAAGIREVMAGRQKQFEFDYTCNGPNEERWFRLLVAPTATRKGVVVMHVNITDLRKAERQARDNEDALAITLDSIGDAVIATDSDGHVVRLNPRARDLTGWTEGDALGRDMGEVCVLVDDEPREISDVPRLTANPVVRVLRAGVACAIANARLVARDGSGHDVSVTAAPIRNSLGELRGVVTVVRDQSEQRRSMEKVRRSRQELLHVLETLPTAVCIVRDERIVFANEQWWRSVHMLPGEPGTLKISDFVIEEDRPLFDEHCATDGRVKATIRFSSRHAQTDDEVAIMQVGALVPVEHHGSPAHVMVMEDITTERRMQRQLLLAERLVSLGTMAAGVAHEINNPLLVVLGNLEMADETCREVLAKLAGSASEDVLAALEELTVDVSDATLAAGRVRFIVQDLKSMSRADGDVTSAMDMVRVLKTSVMMAANETRERARVVCDFADNLPAAIGNEARMGQVFINLLNNAAQAIPDGDASRNEIRLVARFDGTHVVVEVHDPGAGIPPAVMGRIFDPFFTTKAIGVGTGLGLSICSGIVRAFGGELTVRSTVGVGTVFTVRLPAVPLDA